MDKTKIIVKSEDKKIYNLFKKSYGTIKVFSSCSRHLLNKNCFTLGLNIPVGLVRTDPQQNKHPEMWRTLLISHAFLKAKI